MALNIVFFGIKWVASKCIWYIYIHIWNTYTVVIIERIDKMEWFGHLRIRYVFCAATMFFFFVCYSRLLTLVRLSFNSKTDLLICSAWTNWQHATTEICRMFFSYEKPLTDILFVLRSAVCVFFFLLSTIWLWAVFFFVSTEWPKAQITANKIEKLG